MSDEMKVKRDTRLRPIDWNIKIINLKEEDYHWLTNFPRTAVFEIFKDDDWEIVE